MDKCFSKFQLKFYFDAIEKFSFEYFVDYKIRVWIKYEFVIENNYITLF